jgi:hypothetical protein
VRDYITSPTKNTVAKILLLANGNSVAFGLPVASRKNPLEIAFVASTKNPLQM